MSDPKDRDMDSSEQLEKDIDDIYSPDVEEDRDDDEQDKDEE
jgi:hypothetical protein